MDPHIMDFLHTGATILAIFAGMWKMRKDISNEIDTKLSAFEQRLEKRFDAIDRRFDEINKRFDRLEERMARIEQNHLDHITTLHSVPSLPPATKEES